MERQMRLQDLHNILDGDDVDLLCNGPSLNLWNDTGRITMGLNRIYLKRDIELDFYVAVNPILIRQFAPEINQYDVPLKFIPEDISHLISDCVPIPITQEHIFGVRPHQGIWEGGTVTYVALQLLLWFGVGNVYVHGLDHYYTFTGKPNEENTLVGDDPNHFDPSYFKDKRWNNPDLALSEKAYAIARRVYESRGRRIINATPGSHCDIFERQDA
jgi:hypothetical protein